MVVTAQKPSDVAACWGLRFWAVAIIRHPPTGQKKGHIARHNAAFDYCRLKIIARLHYLRFLAARRCSLFIVGVAGGLLGPLGEMQGGTVAGGGALQGVALWPIDTHRARHKQSRSGTGRPPPRAPVP